MQPKMHKMRPQGTLAPDVKINLNEFFMTPEQRLKREQKEKEIEEIKLHKKKDVGTTLGEVKKMIARESELSGADLIVQVNELSVQRLNTKIQRDLRL